MSFAVRQRILNPVLSSPRSATPQFTGNRRTPDPQPNLSAAWQREGVRKRILCMLENGKFRVMPQEGRVFIERLRALCEKGLSTGLILENLRGLLEEQRKNEAVENHLNANDEERVARRNWQIGRLLKDKAPNRFVDVGSGSGKITAALARAFGLSRKQAYGVDIFPPDALNVAYRSVRFDGRHLPFNEKQFDLATFFAVLHHADDPLALLKETTRVLKEDGRVVVREFDAADADLYDFNLVMDHILYKVFEHTPDMPIPGHYLSTDGWRELFSRAGLEVEKLERPEPDNPFNPFLAVLRKKTDRPD